MLLRGDPRGDVRRRGLKGVRGFGSLTLDALEANVDAKVTGVYVHPSVARDGVGTALLTELERYALRHGVRTLGLSTLLNAVSFYEARGYERVREHHHELSAHE